MPAVTPDAEPKAVRLLWREIDAMGAFYPLR
jgi:hypothetical protein